MLNHLLRPFMILKGLVRDYSALPSFLKTEIKPKSLWDSWQWNKKRFRWGYRVSGDPCGSGGKSGDWKFTFDGLLQFDVLRFEVSRLALHGIHAALEQVHAALEFLVLGAQRHHLKLQLLVLASVHLFSIHRHRR